MQQEDFFNSRRGPVKSLPQIPSLDHSFLTRVFNVNKKKKTIKFYLFCYTYMHNRAKSSNSQRNVADSFRKMIREDDADEIPKSQASSSQGQMQLHSQVVAQRVLKTHVSNELSVAGPPECHKSRVEVQKQP